MEKNVKYPVRPIRRLAIISAIAVTAFALTACGKYTKREVGASVNTPAVESSQLPIHISGGEENAGSDTAGGKDTNGITAGSELPAAAEQEAAAVSGTDPFFLQSGMKQEEAAAFVKTFVNAVISGNRESAAAMISYPRSVKTPAWEGTVNSPEEFMAYYDEIFTADFRKSLENASLDDLFCSDGMISFGEGSLWFYPATESEDMSVCTVNAAEDRYVRYGGPAGVQPG